MQFDYRREAYEVDLGYHVAAISIWYTGELFGA